MAAPRTPNVGTRKTPNAKPESPRTSWENATRRFARRAITQSPSGQPTRKQKIAQAAALQVGAEPPKETEIQEALRLLKSIAENPDKSICSTEELKLLSEELSKDRPEWAECLTPAHTHTSTEDAKWAKLQIEEMMDTRFSKTVFAKTLEN